MPAPGSWQEYVADLCRAVQIANRQPWLWALEFGLTTLFAAAAVASQRAPEDGLVGFVFFLSTVLTASLLGWLGVQRQVFRGAMVGEPVQLQDVPSLLLAQGARFLRLGFLLAPVGAVALAILAVTSTGDQPLLDPSVTGEIGVVLLGAGVTAAAVLVTPTLALETHRARDAWGMGLRRLRANPRALRWHALVPAGLFALTAVTDATGEGWAAVVGYLTSLLTIVFRGGAVAAWLRVRDGELTD